MLKFVGIKNFARNGDGGNATEEWFLWECHAVVLLDKVGNFGTQLFTGFCLVVRLSHWNIVLT